MHHANFSPSVLIPSRVLLHCPLCNGIFRTHLEFMNHVQVTHPLLSEQTFILCSSVYASNIILPGNQHVPQHASLQRNDEVVVQPASSLNHSQMRRWDRAPPIDRQQMARMSRVIEGSNSTFVYSNRTFVDCTQQVPNQLGVPISSNADEAVNTTEEHNELDLNLKL
ncbi:hypothetical protein P3S68_023316 [Capsicum galapagoense]